MHAAVTYPGAFGGVFAQSGSFFPIRGSTPMSSASRSTAGWSTSSIASTPSRRGWPACASRNSGLGEENLDNNRALDARLRKRGVDSRLTEGRDGHNYTAWRDLLDPALGDLLARVWGIGLGG